MTAPNLPGGPAYSARWAAVRAAWEHPALRRLTPGHDARDMTAYGVLTDAVRVLLCTENARSHVAVALDDPGRESWDAFAAVLAPHVAARVESEGGGGWEARVAWGGSRPAGAGWEPVALGLTRPDESAVLWRRRVPVQP